MPTPAAFNAAAEPLLRHLGLGPGRTRGYLDDDRYVLRGDLLPDAEEIEDDREREGPLTPAAALYQGMAAPVRRGPPRTHAKTDMCRGIHLGVKRPPPDAWRGKPR